MDSIDRLWERIENWLAANAPDIARALKPGITDEEIREIEAGMGGLIFPEDVKASYRRHGGYSQGSFLMDQSILYDLSGMFRGQSGWEDRLGYDLTRKPEYLSV
jgi:cell wall assembly regulator SMI1